MWSTNPRCLVTPSPPHVQPVSPLCHIPALSIPGFPLSAHRCLALRRCRPPTLHVCQLPCVTSPPTCVHMVHFKGLYHGRRNWANATVNKGHKGRQKRPGNKAPFLKSHLLVLQSSPCTADWRLPQRDLVASVRGARRGVNIDDQRATCLVVHAGLFCLIVVLLFIIYCFVYFRIVSVLLLSSLVFSQGAPIHALLSKTTLWH